MYRIDVYKDNKKVTSHWYPTKEQANAAKKAIAGMPKKKYTFVPGENRPEVTKELGGWTVSKVIEESK